jgi:hypothetical protein
MLGGREHVDISVRMDVTEFDRLYMPAQQRQQVFDLRLSGWFGFILAAG